MIFIQKQNACVLSKKISVFRHSLSGVDVKFGFQDHGKIALGFGLVAGVLHKMSELIDRTSPSSKAEDYMDQLIDKFDRGFNVGMKKVVDSIAEGDHKRQKLEALGKHAEKLKSQGQTFKSREAKRSVQRRHRDM